MLFFFFFVPILYYTVNTYTILSYNVHFFWLFVILGCYKNPSIFAINNTPNYIVFAWNIATEKVNLRSVPLMDNK